MDKRKRASFCPRLPGRRRFLAQLPTLALGLEALLSAQGTAGEPEGGRGWEPASLPERGTGTKVRVAFLRIKGQYWMGWPGAAYDVEGHRKQFEEQIASVAKQLNISIPVEKDYIYDPAGAEQFVARVKKEAPDGLLLIPLHLRVWNTLAKIVDGAGLPTIIYAPVGTAFTGHLKPYENRTGTLLISSLEFDRVALGLRMFKVRRQLAESRIINLRGNQEREQKIPGLGTTFHYLPRDLFAEELKKVQDTAEVKAIAKYYAEHAKDIVEPNERDMLNAAKNYVLSRQLIEKYNADGITMDCLGLVGARKIPCPPCLAWMMLNDQGAPAACESDINAALTYLLVQRLLGKPGFMQDPVPLTPGNIVIGAHCTCPTRLWGFDKPPVPYILRSHSESNIGVSIETLWPIHEKITITKFLNPQRMVIDTGFVLDNIHTPPAGGCRTSVKVRLTAVGNAQDWIGFHQVFVLGNHREDIRGYCRLFGIEAIRS